MLRSFGSESSPDIWPDHRTKDGVSEHTVGPGTISQWTTDLRRLAQSVDFPFGRVRRSTRASDWPSSPRPRDSALLELNLFRRNIEHLDLLANCYKIPDPRIARTSFFPALTLVPRRENSPEFWLGTVSA